MYNNTHYESPIEISIGGDATMQAISSVCDRLSRAFQDNSSIILKLDGLESFDLTLVQLVESARTTATRLNKSFSLAAPVNDELRKMLERGGFVPASASQSRQFWLHEEVQ